MSTVRQVRKGKVYSIGIAFCTMLPEREGSGSIVRSSIPAFRAEDPGPNPGRSTTISARMAVSKFVWQGCLRRRPCSSNIFGSYTKPRG